MQPHYKELAEAETLMVAPLFPETRNTSLDFVWCESARESPSLALKKESLTLGAGALARFLAAVSSNDHLTGLIDGEPQGSVHLPLIGTENSPD